MKLRSENAERSLSTAACREEKIVVDVRNIKMNISETFCKGVMLMMI
jgi:hypothetical protein